MAGKLTATTLQVGDSATATNNFVLKADNAGGVKLSRGNDGATTQDILSVASDGKVTLNQGVAGLSSTSDTLSLGYGTGAGGTVTQLTSKSTAVTLNKSAGKITLHNASLASNGVVVFTLNNSLLTNNDVVIFSIDASTTATDPSYMVQSYDVGSGFCNVRLTNLTGGSLSEAVGINFVILKGATA